MTLHIGYYITAKQRIKVSDTTIRRCAKNALHSFDHSDKFCRRCGGKITSFDAAEGRALTYDDIPPDEGDITDQFIFPEYSAAPEGEIIAVSNWTGCGQFRTDGNDYIISDLDIDKEELYNEFMEKHGHDIELLKKYVYDDVEVKFGLVTYDY